MERVNEQKKQEEVFAYYLIKASSFSARLYNKKEATHYFFDIAGAAQLFGIRENGDAKLLKMK